MTMVGWYPVASRTMNPMKQRRCTPEQIIRGLREAEGL